MARAKITYVHNPDTGKREWHIHYESPADATVSEHEASHRKLVKQLLGELEGPDLEVARGEPGKAPAQPKPEEPQNKVPRSKDT